MKYLDCGCAITDNGRAWCPSCEAAAPQEAREPEGVEKLMSELARIARLFRSASELGSAVLVPIAADIDNARATIKALAAARPAPEAREPTQAEIDDACMWYRHDFGLMSDEDAGRLRFTAREWLRAWHKAGFRELLGAPAPAEATERSEP